MREDSCLYLMTSAFVPISAGQDAEASRVMEDFLTRFLLRETHPSEIVPNESGNFTEQADYTDSHENAFVRSLEIMGQPHDIVYLDIIHRTFAFSVPA